MRFRTLSTALVSIGVLLVTAAPALADGAGEGWAGETNDRVVTFFCFGVLLFFVLVVCLGTVIQNVLEKRKNARKAAKMRQRVGW